MNASRRGQHAKAISPIVDPEFRAQFCSYVRSESCKKGIYKRIGFCKNVKSCSKSFRTMFESFACLGQPHLTASALAKWVNQELQLGEDEKYSDGCIRLWLHECGFKVLFAHLFCFKYGTVIFKGQRVQEGGLR